MNLGKNVSGILKSNLRFFHWEELNDTTSLLIKDKLWNTIEVFIWDLVNKSVLELSIHTEYVIRTKVCSLYRKWK